LENIESKISASLRSIATQLGEEQAYEQNELLKAANILDLTAATLRHLAPEQYPYTAFIVGQSKEVDKHNLPLELYVVPAYGVDFRVRYILVDHTGTKVHWPETGETL
jgi:hypothetical protein